MSHNNQPTKTQDSTTSTQADNAPTAVGKLVRVVGGQVQEIRGNATWDTIKFVAEKHEKWLPYLLWGWGVLSGAVYAAVQAIRGIPVDWLIIGLLVVLSVLPMAGAFVYSKLRGRQTALEPRKASRPDADGTATRGTAQTEAKPNLVFLRSDTAYVYTDDGGKIVEYINKPRTPTWRRNHPGYFAIVALFHNQPTSSHKLASTGRVSAQLTYQFPGQAPFIIPRGLWYPEHSTVVNFGVNSYHGLILATVHDRETLCAAQGESVSFTDLDTDEVVVHALITSESDASVVKESRLKIRVTKKPEFHIEVSELSTAHEEVNAAQEQPQSMNELIRAAARDIEKVPCGMGWLHAIAENDRTEIQNAVQVRGIILRNLIDDGIPRLEFVFTIYNKSVYEISIDDAIDGYIRFGRQEKLRKTNLEMKENQVVDCPPRGSRHFTLEQTLLDSEARFIMGQFDDKEFWFDELVIMIKGGTHSPKVVKKQLKIDGHVSRKDQLWRNYND